MVVKLSKIIHSLAKHLVCLKDCIDFFQKMVLLIGFRVTVHEILMVETWKKTLCQQKIIEILYFQELTSC